MPKIFLDTSMKDYESAKLETTNQIVRKQSRGNVAIQNGWSLDSQKLAKMSLSADAHIEQLRKAFATAKK